EEDDKGRKFATRLEYSKMSDSQRRNHYHLTVDNLIQELVSDTAKYTSERIKSEKDRISKMAAKMGFVQAPANGEVKKQTDAAKSVNQDPAPVKEPDVTKPLSPSAGGGVPTDNKA